MGKSRQAADNGFAGGRKNLIINGDFGVWQRGTSFVTPTNGAYTADRWAYSYAGTGITLERATSGGHLVDGGIGKYMMKMTGASGNTGANIYQRIESIDCYEMASKPVVFSAVVYSSTARTVTVYFTSPDSGDDNYATATVRHSQSFSVASGWDVIEYPIASLSNECIRGLQILISVPSLGSGELMYYNDIQLEIGTKATPFERIGFAEQFEQCQRYYEKSNALANNPNTTTPVNAEYRLGGPHTTALPGFRFTVEKRVVPTLTILSIVTGATGNIRNAGGFDVAATVNHLSTSGISFLSTTVVDGNNYYWHWYADAEL